MSDSRRQVGASADDSAAGPGWSTGNREHGWIDAEKIGRLAFPPAEGTVVWVCGQPGMYTVSDIHSTHYCQRRRRRTAVSHGPRPAARH